MFFCFIRWEEPPNHTHTDRLKSGLQTPSPTAQVGRRESLSIRREEATPPTLSYVDEFVLKIRRMFPTQADPDSTRNTGSRLRRSPVMQLCTWHLHGQAPGDKARIRHWPNGKEGVIARLKFLH